MQPGVQSCKRAARTAGGGGGSDGDGDRLLLPVERSKARGDGGDDGSTSYSPRFLFLYSPRERGILTAMAVVPGAKYYYKFLLASRIACRGALLVAINILLVRRFPCLRLRTMNRAASAARSLSLSLSFHLRFKPRKCSYK